MIFPLQHGSKGPYVRQLQHAANKSLGYPRVRVDGDWGSETEMAVQEAFGKGTVTSSDLSKIIMSTYKGAQGSSARNVLNTQLGLRHAG